MNIRKIIREEMEDFDWIKKINPGDPPENIFSIPEGQKFLYIGHGGEEHIIRFNKVGEAAEGHFYARFDFIDGKHDGGSFVILDPRYKRWVKLGKLKIMYDINESKEDFDWIKEIPPYELGEFFKDAEVCFDDNTGCDINIEEDTITFNVGLDEWVEFTDLREEDSWYLLPFMRMGSEYVDRNDWYQFDSDEINYIGHYMTPEQEDRLQKILSFTSDEEDFNLESYTNDAFYEVINHLKYPTLRELFQNQMWEILNIMGYAIQRNRWIIQGNAYSKILEDAGIEVEINSNRYGGEEVEITVPRSRLRKADNNLSQLLYQESIKLTGIPWDEWFWGEWDTSGEEEAIASEFDEFLNKAETFLNEETDLIKEFDEFISKIEPLGFKPYTRINATTSTFVKNNKDGTYWFIKPENGYDKIKLELRKSLYRGNIIESFKIPLNRLSDYINNYRLDLGESKDFDWIRDTNPIEIIDLYDEDHVKTIQVGDRLEITGEQDGIEFQYEPCEVVCLGDCVPHHWQRDKNSAWNRQVLVSFDRPFYSNETGENTHCGPDGLDKCDCDLETGDGLCWWIAIPDMEEVVRIYTN